MPLQEALVLVTGKLTATIRMQDDRGFHFALSQRLAPSAPHCGVRNNTSVINILLSLLRASYCVENEGEPNPQQFYFGIMTGGTAGEGKKFVAGSKGRLEIPVGPGEYPTC